MSVEMGVVQADRVASPGRWRRLGQGAGAAVVVLVVAIVLFPGLFSGYDPTTNDVVHSLLPPSPAHLFGTDQFGRDVYTRVIYGARISLLTGLGAVVTGLGGGVLVGLLSALGRRLTDGVVMRVVDVLLAFPEMLLALLVVAVLGRGSVNVALAIGLAAVPHFARLVRGQALAVMRSEYVEAARVLGVRPVRYLRRHVLPNVAGPLVVMASIGTGSAITASAGLSVLGLGPPAPSPEWGAMLADGEDYLGSAWWVAVFPGLAVVLVVLSLTLIGRATQARGVR